MSAQIALTKLQADYDVCATALASLIGKLPVKAQAEYTKQAPISRALRRAVDLVKTEKPVKAKKAPKAKKNKATEPAVEPQA